MFKNSGAKIQKNNELISKLVNEQIDFLVEA